MKKIIFAVLLLQCSILGNAQISYEERVEFEVKPTSDYQGIIAFGDKGFVKTSRNLEIKGADFELGVELYNTDFELINSGKVLLAKNILIDESHTSENKHHKLYTDNKGNYALVSIDIEDFTVVKVEGKWPKKTLVYDMVILGDYAYMYSKMKKSAPILYLVNWKTGEQKSLPVAIEGANPKKVYPQKMQVMENTNEVFMFVEAVMDKSGVQFFLLKFNEAGNIVESLNISKDIEHNILTITANKISDDKYIFTGTYARESSAMAEGVFFYQTSDGDVDFIKHYAFEDLENSLSYLSEEEKARLQKHKVKLDKKGKEYVLKHQVTAHDLIQLEDGYLFLGEAYYKSYRQESYTSTSANGGTSTHTRNVFNGYQYTHAMLIKIDEEGDLLWDDTFEMWSAYKPYSVRHLVSVAGQDQSSIRLVYSSRNKMTATSFDYDGSVILESESEEIETNSEEDQTITRFSDVDYWYDEYFLAYGEQRIKNKENKGDKKRTVYFVTKIMFE